MFNNNNNISAQCKIDNKKFETKEKAFYRSLTKELQIRNNEYPTKDEITDFWKSIWSEEKTHKRTADWIETEKEKFSNVNIQQEISLTDEDITKVINNTHNWKATGLDHIHNYWYKQLNTTHKQLAKCINDLLHNPRDIPKFLTTGITYILPKNQQTKNPENYHPITCLSTLYRIITSVISTIIYLHIESHNIMSEEQKGCKKNSLGCKEQLTIDTVILQQAEKEHRNLHICYIDYRKAFDFIPHSWLIQVLEIYKINPNVIQFLLGEAMDDTNHINHRKRQHSNRRD